LTTVVSVRFTSASSFRVNLLLLGDEAQLLEGGDAVVETDLLGDQPVFDLDHGGAGELHPLARARRQGSDGDVVEGVAGMRAAALPLADDVVALGDEIGRSLEPEVRERGTELRGEVADLVPAAARRCMEYSNRISGAANSSMTSGL